MNREPTSSMTELRKVLGRFLVAASLVVFGVQHFLYGGFVATLVPAFMPGRLFWAYFVGVAFFAAAGGILYKLMARPAATMLGVMFFLFVVLLHIPRIVGNFHDGNEWTSGFVALAFCGGSWILASASPLEEREKADPFLRLGRYFFALAFVAFGIQHFVYLHFYVSSAAVLGPPWYHGSRLVGSLIGLILFGTGFILLFWPAPAKVADLLAGTLFLYFAVFYVPLILSQFHSPAAWTSGCEILALCGFALVLSGSFCTPQRS